MFRTPGRQVWRCSSPPEIGTWERSLWAQPGSTATFTFDYLKDSTNHHRPLPPAARVNADHQLIPEWCYVSYEAELNPTRKSITMNPRDRSATTTPMSTPSQVGSSSVNRDTYVATRVWCSEEPERDYQTKEDCPWRCELGAWITDPQDPPWIRHGTRHVQQRNMTSSACPTGGVVRVGTSRSNEHAEVHCKSQSQSIVQRRTSEDTKSIPVHADNSIDSNTRTSDQVLSPIITKKQTEYVSEEHARVRFHNAYQSENSPKRNSSAKMLVRNNISQITAGDSSKKLSVLVDDIHDSLKPCTCGPKTETLSVPSKKVRDHQIKSEDAWNETIRTQLKDRLLKLLTTKTLLKESNSSGHLISNTKESKESGADRPSQRINCSNNQRPVTNEQPAEVGPNDTKYQDKSRDLKSKEKLYFTVDGECAEQHDKLNPLHFGPSSMHKKKHLRKVGLHQELASCERLLAVLRNDLCKGNTENAKVLHRRDNIIGKSCPKSLDVTDSNFQTFIEFETRPRRKRSHDLRKEWHRRSSDKEVGWTSRENKDEPEGMICGSSSFVNDLEDIRNGCDPMMKEGYKENQVTRPIYENKPERLSDPVPVYVRCLRTFPTDLQLGAGSWPHQYSESCKKQNHRNSVYHCAAIPPACHCHLDGTKWFHNTDCPEDDMSKLYERNRPRVVRHEVIDTHRDDTGVSCLERCTCDLENDDGWCGVRGCYCRKHYGAWSQHNDVGLSPSEEGLKQTWSVTRCGTGNVCAIIPDSSCYGKPVGGGLRANYTSSSDDSTNTCSSAYNNLHTQDNEKSYTRRCICDKLLTEQNTKQKESTGIIRDKNSSDASICEFRKFHRRPAGDTLTTIDDRPRLTDQHLKPTAESSTNFTNVVCSSSNSPKCEGPRYPCHIPGCDCKKFYAINTGKLINTKNHDPKSMCRVPGCNCKKSKGMADKMPAPVKHPCRKNSHSSPSCQCNRDNHIKYASPQMASHMRGRKVMGQKLNGRKTAKKFKNKEVGRNVARTTEHATRRFVAIATSPCHLDARHKPDGVRSSMKKNQICAECARVHGIPK